MKSILLWVFLVSLFAIGGCGKGSDTPQSKSQGSSAQSGVSQAASGLTQFEMEHGIGPITQPITLGPIDNNLADKGAKIFETKCTSCHKLNERYVGPSLGNVTARRKPEFIMNMILNPDGMLKKHPEVRKLLADYLTPMTFQNVTQEDARAILEYLRRADAQRPVSAISQ